MINKTNYFEVAKNVDFSKHKDLHEMHELITSLTDGGNDWSVYDNNEDGMQPLIDKLFKAVDKIAGKPEKPAAPKKQSKQVLPKTIFGQMEFHKNKLVDYAIDLEGEDETIYAGTYSSIEDAIRDNDITALKKEVSEMPEWFSQFHDKKAREFFEIEYIEMAHILDIEIKPVKKAAKEKRPRTKEKKVGSSGNLVERYDDDVRFLKRYLGLDGKTKTKEQLKSLLSGLQKGILERRIRKTSPHVKQIERMQDNLVSTINKMAASVKIELHPDTKKELEKIVSGQTELVSIKLIKRYINLVNKPNKAKAENLRNDLQKYFDNLSVSTNDKYYKYVATASNNLNSYLSNGKLEMYSDVELTGFPPILRAAIAGAVSETAKQAIEKTLGNIGESYQSDKTKVIDDDLAAFRKGGGHSSFRGIGDVAGSGNTFTLNGDIGKLLGKLERYKLAISLEGDQGAGKTQFAFQLADAFAEAGKTVGMFSLEEGANTDLVTRKRDQYIKPLNLDKIKITDTATHGIRDVEKAAKMFDVVIIDTWGKLYANSSYFDMLRTRYPNTIFVVLFQRVSNGVIKGGTAPLFDAGINLEAVKVDDSFKNNYVIATKNRYGETGYKFNIFSRKIIQEHTLTKKDVDSVSNEVSNTVKLV